MSLNHAAERTTSMLIRFLIVSLLAWASLPAAAQTLVKCKQANGTYSFQDTPCPINSKQEVNQIDASASSQLAPAPSPPPVTRIAPVTSPEPVLASDPGQADNAIDTATTGVPKPGSLVLVVMFFILVTVGYIWMLIVSFKNSFIWCLLCFFFLPAIYIFSALNWPEAKKPFLIIHFGVALLILGVINDGYPLRMLLL